MVQNNRTRKTLSSIFVCSFLISCSSPQYRDITRQNYKNIAVKSSNNYNYTTSTRNYSGIYKVGKPYKIAGKKYYPKEVKSYKETGMASWYGDDFHNKRTANGEIFNKNDLTCAHKTLPLPSIVKIVNLENGKEIIARVNDRGPFAKDRLLDVSEKVAQKLDFKNQGTTKVKVILLKEETDKFLRQAGLT